LKLRKKHLFGAFFILVQGIFSVVRIQMFSKSLEMKEKELQQFTEKHRIEELI